MNIIDVKWYSGMTTYVIGIVLLDRVDGHRAYIGTALGNNEGLDALHIANKGAKFPNSDAAKLWPDVKEWAP